MIHSYPWYMADWLTSPTRHEMSAESRGIYRDLLDFSYQDGSIPADETVLRKMAAVTEKEWARAWPEVKRQFEERGDGRLYHSKVEAVLPELLALAQQRRDSARRAAGARWRGNAPRNAPRNASRIADASSGECERNAFACATSSSSSTTTNTNTESVDARRMREFPDDAAERIAAIGAAWPTTADLEMGKRLLAEAIADAENPLLALATAEVNLGGSWVAYYRQKPAKYRKTLANAVRGGDWMHPAPKEDAAAPIETKADRMLRALRGAGDAVRG